MIKQKWGEITEMENRKMGYMNCTSHPASKASLKSPSEIECLPAASDSLICVSQYDAEERTLNFFRLVDFETSEAGVSLFTDLLDLASEIGVMLPSSFGAGVPAGLGGLESLLGGLAGLSLPERSRTPTLLLRVDAGLPLKKGRHPI